MTQETQKYIGKHQLIDRLAARVGNRDVAIRLLQQRGHLMADGTTLTPEGRKRDAMTAEERAKDRASPSTGVPTSELKYNPKTNTARR